MGEDFLFGHPVHIYLYNRSKTVTTAEGERHLGRCEQRVHGRGAAGYRASVTTDAYGGVIRRSAAAHTHPRAENRAAVLNLLHDLRIDAIAAPDDFATWRATKK